MTLRVPDEMYAEMVGIATIEGRTVSDVIRRAIAEHVDRRRRDPEFQRRLRAYMAEQEAVYRRLLGQGES